MRIIFMKDLAVKDQRGFQLGANAGFTLIELMIVVVIASILIAIAVPLYQTEVRKSRRTEAKTTVLDAAAREERYYATQNTYSNDTGALGYATASGTFPFTTGTYYEILSIVVTAPVASATGVTSGTFTIKVQPFTGSTQVQDTPCQVFQVDQTGKQSSLDSSGNDSTTTCWP
jgi:type IV pilus assembly protein PilE